MSRRRLGRVGIKPPAAPRSNTCRYPDCGCSDGQHERCVSSERGPSPQCNTCEYYDLHGSGNCGYGDAEMCGENVTDMAACDLYQERGSDDEDEYANATPVPATWGTLSLNGAVVSRTGEGRAASCGNCRFANLPDNRPNVLDCNNYDSPHGGSVLSRNTSMVCAFHEDRAGSSRNTQCPHCQSTNTRRMTSGYYACRSCARHFDPNAQSSAGGPSLEYVHYLVETNDGAPHWAGVSLEAARWHMQHYAEQSTHGEVYRLVGITSLGFRVSIDSWQRSQGGPSPCPSCQSTNVVMDNDGPEWYCYSCNTQFTPQTPAPSVPSAGCPHCHSTDTQRQTFDPGWFYCRSCAATYS